MKFILALSLLFSAQLAFAYDSSWHQEAGWSGEYPAGFQVYKKGIVKLGRTSIDRDEAPTVACVLKRNKYSASKAIPKADYVEVTKIVNMIAKKDFTYVSSVVDDPTIPTFKDISIDIKQGELVEYLAYGSEGWFLARHNGVEFWADQDLLESVTYATDENGWMNTDVDQWVKLSCANNVSTWFMLSDFYTVDKDGNTTWIDGVRSFFHNPY